MNWTGGGLHRHSGNSAPTIQLQKTHFAKLRKSRLGSNVRQSGSLPVGTPLQFTSDVAAFKDGDEHRSIATPSEASIHPRHHQHRSALHDLPNQRLGAGQGQEDNAPKCEDKHQSQTTSALEGKRKRLLEDHDWMGLACKRPRPHMTSKFQNRPSPSREYKPQNVSLKRKSAATYNRLENLATEDISVRIGSYALPTPPPLRPDTLMAPDAQVSDHGSPHATDSDRRLATGSSRDRLTATNLRSLSTGGSGTGSRSTRRKPNSIASLPFSDIGNAIIPVNTTSVRETPEPSTLDRSFARDRQIIDRSVAHRVQESSERSRSTYEDRLHRSSSIPLPGMWPPTGAGQPVFLEGSQQVRKGPVRRPDHTLPSRSAPSLWLEARASIRDHPPVRGRNDFASDIADAEARQTAAAYDPKEPGTSYLRRERGHETSRDRVVSSTMDHLPVPKAAPRLDHEVQNDTGRTASLPTTDQNKATQQSSKDDQWKRFVFGSSSPDSPDHYSPSPTRHVDLSSSSDDVNNDGDHEPPRPKLPYHSLVVQQQRPQTPDRLSMHVNRAHHRDQDWTSVQHQDLSTPSDRANLPSESRIARIGSPGSSAYLLPRSQGATAHEGTYLDPARSGIERQCRTPIFSAGSSASTTRADAGSWPAMAVSSPVVVPQTMERGLDCRQGWHGPVARGGRVEDAIEISSDGGDGSDGEEEEDDDDDVEYSSDG